MHCAFRRPLNHWHDIVPASSVLPSTKNHHRVCQLSLGHVGGDAIPFANEGANSSNSLFQPAFYPLYSPQRDSWLPSAACDWMS